MKTPGRFQVEQLTEKGTVRFDFDADEWSFEWTTRNGVEILRLLHDRDPEATTSFDFVEFSKPVSVAFVFED